ncbi:Uu.00g056920.m01.CDS01 [Anthostomella pinea]|uniref:Uu.00g056920.m01.CDS01 n=1 Tax=Anthostomella pinea TaxID=933095 RepID=A0AAI8VSR4_9PEZI|nr:Uu.00g056920.m01.CDS01 [Anthostomella pinea]
MRFSKVVLGVWTYFIMTLFPVPALPSSPTYRLRKGHTVDGDVSIGHETTGAAGEEDAETVQVIDAAETVDAADRMEFLQTPR